MISIANSTRARNQSADASLWEIPMLITHITNVCMLSCSIWVLLSMIVYGTKSRRWIHRPSSSSLSSGLVYISCTLSVFLAIVRFSTTEVLFKLPAIPGGLEHCETVCDIDNGAYALSSYGAYCFLWVRLRLIYNHPYVKTRIGARANLISQFGLGVITIAAAGLFFFYTVPEAYDQSPIGCVYGERVPDQFLQGTRRNILIVVTLVLSQTAMIYLCMYPAIRVDFDSIRDAKNRDADHGPTQPTWQRFRSLISNKGSLKSPVQLAVRRTLISCIVMVIASIIFLIPAVIFIPRSAPAQIRRTLYNLGTFINVFCVLATLGFAIRILTLFFPSCPRREYIKPHRFCREESVLSTSVQVDMSADKH